MYALLSRITSDEAPDKLRIVNMLKLPSVLVFLVTLSLALSYSSNMSSARNFLACPTLRLKNGRVRYRQKTGFAQFQCNKSFILAGAKYMKCLGTHWEDVVPKCVRNTCKPPKIPKNGFVYPSHRDAVLNYFCKVGYELHGVAIVYCDGENWDSILPTCLETNKTASINCNFENADLCGWSHELNHDFDWIRFQHFTPTGNIGTGPSYDHTFGANGDGYYMYIEATSRHPNDTARLISPPFATQSNETCLEFYYHMYGQHIGELRAYLKKVSDKSWNFQAHDAIFSRDSNQGNGWKFGIVDLGSVDGEFQIIFEGVRGNGYLGDIAIDDVRIIENCNEREYEETTQIDFSEQTTTFEPDIPENSCFNRCNIKHAGSLGCDCDYDCYITDACCQDFVPNCLFDIDLFSNSSPLDFTETTEISAKDHEVTSGTTSTSLIIVEPRPTSRTTVEMVIKDTNSPNDENNHINLEIPTQGMYEATLRPTTRKIATTTRKLIIPITNLTRTTPRPLKTTTPTKRFSPTTLKRVSPTTLKRVSPTTLKKYFPPTTTTRISKITLKPVLTTKPPTRTNRTTKPETTIATKSKTTTLKQMKKVIETNEVYKKKISDFATVPAQINAEDVELINDFQIDNKKSQKMETGDQNWSMLRKILVYGGVSCCLVVFVAFLAKKSKFKCRKFRHMRNNSHGDSQSDVRFLTGDEILDFNLQSDD